MLKVNQLVGFGAGGSSFSTTNSGDFELSDPDYMHRTPSSASNRTTWTISLWYKRESTGTDIVLFSATNGTPFLTFGFNSTLLAIDQYNGSGRDFFKLSTATWNDTNWHHFVVALDTTDGTAEDRIKVYMDGTRITAWGGANTNPSASLVTYANNTTLHALGVRADGHGDFDGLMAEVNFIDGLQLTPADFALSNLPIEYVGAYGTNGFYMAFKNSGALGEDSSTNGNDLTNSGVTQSSTVPT